MSFAPSFGRLSAALVGLTLLALPALPATRILIVSSSSAGGYGEALEGLHNALADQETTLRSVDLSAPGGAARLQEALGHGHAHVVVAVGTRALASVAGRPEVRQLVATMVFASETNPNRLQAAVTLDVPLGSLLTRLRGVVPGLTSIGVIRTPTHLVAPIAALRNEARQAGFSLQARDCQRPEDLLRIFLDFQRQVDAVWCPPDGALFNGATVKPLVLESLRAGLPIIGFSENFVRAGAALGVYPDYTDIGQQTGELVRRLADGRDLPRPVQPPRSLRVAVNQRVVHLMGLRPVQPADLRRFLVLR
jgi:ABC-type uncharacterized transport system substrate-binding protein